MTARVLLFSVSILSVLSCSGRQPKCFKSFDADLPTNQKALLLCEKGVWITCIDDCGLHKDYSVDQKKWEPILGAKCVEILPGIRNVTVYYYWGVYSDYALELEFFASPGHTYRIISNTGRLFFTSKGLIWNPEVIDEDGDPVSNGFSRSPRSHVLPK